MLGAVRWSSMVQVPLAAALCLAAAACGKSEADLSARRHGTNHGCALSAGCSGGDGSSDLQIALTAEAMVLPADTIHYQAVVTNQGSIPATFVNLTVLLPDATTHTFELGTLEVGASTTTLLEWPRGLLTARQPDESAQAYSDRLGNLYRPWQVATTTVTWTGGGDNSAEMTTQTVHP
jgi:uncharacterized repeat protein (TIGR01451 family)